jgi:prepilin-type N-terminal cleavage/methylation domain-containing protein
VRHRRSPAHSRPGVTLLELIVVLALLGLLLAVAAPAFVIPSEKKESELAVVLAAAQRAAILRAEPVTLIVSENGNWRVDSPSTANTSPIATGTLARSAGGLRVQISPLGTCVATEGASSLPNWNALQCRTDAVERVPR